MKFKFLLLFIISILQIQLSYSQEKTKLKWWNPDQSDFNVIEGQGWSKDLESGFDRLPEEAKKKVRKPLWNLSKNSAGLLIRFKTNSKEISVKYRVKGDHAMPHMPATGVSGVDLYAQNSNGEWIWFKGNYSFGKTIKYNFKNIDLSESSNDKEREYQLYLPLYNSVEWLEIGVFKNTFFEPLPVRKEKPIVIYGTSIAQGACASRPGMAWTSILERKMDMPLINLGFSGNGLLEKELIDLMTQIDAKIYILDCLPNLTPTKKVSLQEVYQRIIRSVKTLHQKQPSVPVLLVEHAGYANPSTNERRQVVKLNNIMQDAFDQLKSEGIHNIYLLSKDEIDLNLDSYVDGTHPSDYGMVNYANAYWKILNKILKNKQK